MVAYFSIRYDENKPGPSLGGGRPQRMLKMTPSRAGINHFQLKQICIPLVLFNQGTNSIKGTVGVLTWGHLSHWLLTASCSDIWPQNSAWQRPSNSLRSVRQTQMKTADTETHSCATKFTTSHFFFPFFLTDVLCLQTPADVHANITVRASFDFIIHCPRLLRHYSSFRDRLTVNYSVSYKWDKEFCQHPWTPGSSLLSLLQENYIFLTSKHTPAC